MYFIPSPQPSPRRRGGYDANTYATINIPIGNTSAGESLFWNKLEVGLYSGIVEVLGVAIEAVS